MSTPKVLTLQGKIDFHLSLEVAESLGAIIANTPKRVIVDLSQVTYLDSSGLAVLIEAMQNTEKYGGEFLLAATHDDVRLFFEIACLDRIFKLSPDVDCALAAA